MKDRNPNPKLRKRIARRRLAQQARRVEPCILLGMWWLSPPRLYEMPMHGLSLWLDFDLDSLTQDPCRFAAQRVGMRNDVTRQKCRSMRSFRVLLDVSIWGPRVEPSR